MGIRKIDNKYLDDIFSLYELEGWTSYTKEKESLKRMLEKSSTIGFFQNDILIGILRFLTDGEHLLYIQDLIVKKENRRQKIATQLINNLLENYSNIRNINLITDSGSLEANKFYQKIGFTNLTNLNLNGYYYIGN